MVYKIIYIFKKNDTKRFLSILYIYNMENDGNNSNVLVINNINNTSSILTNLNENNEIQENNNEIQENNNMKTKSKRKIVKKINPKQQLIENYTELINKKCSEHIDLYLKKNKQQKNIPEVIYVDNYDYEYIIKYKHNIEGLKTIAKQFGLKVGGNKNELINRLYNYLRLSFYAVKIQKLIKGFLQRKCNKLHGPAYLKREICTNNSDFFTMEELNEISYSQFYSFKDSDGHIYGFDIVSLYNLISKTQYGKKPQNPYNRSFIDPSIINDLKRLIKLSRTLKQPIDIDIKEDEQELSLQKTIELRTVALFQKIDALGNYSNPNWFLSLNRHEIIKLIRELTEIWNYRAQITNETKRAICPPNGDLFRNVSLHYLQTEPEINNIRKITLEIFEKLVNNGINDESKSLGAIYVLGSLTLVNTNAAEALPWLYQSFSYF